MGEESEQVLLQLKGEPNSYAEALKSFDDYFIPRRNIIFERYKFNSCVQKPGDTVDVFITSLHSLAEYCEFGNLKDELIRDRIVVGMLDVKTSERLQLQANLTLDEAILAARQAEVQSRQNQFLRSEARSDVRVQDVRAIQKYTKRSTDPGKGSKVQKQQEGAEQLCSRCGKQWHPKEKCQAKNSACNRCKNIGHWGKVCRAKKSIKLVSCEEEPKTDSKVSEQYFVGTVDTQNMDQWYAQIKVVDFNLEVKFLVDTGADVTCVPLNMLPESYLNKVQSVNEVISGPDGNQLSVLGKINLDLEYKGNISKIEVYVLKKLKIPILGRPALVKLKVLKFNVG